MCMLNVLLQTRPCLLWSDKGGSWRILRWPALPCVHHFKPATDTKACVNLRRHLDQASLDRACFTWLCTHKTSHGKWPFNYMLYVRVDDLNSLTNDTQKLKTTRNVPVRNKDGLVITQIMYFWIKNKKSFKSMYDIVRPSSPNCPLCVCLCISLSPGLSAIITSCGLITTLPKKSHDLKVIVTWHSHFSSHPSPLPSLCLPLWKPWQQTG